MNTYRVGCLALTLAAGLAAPASAATFTVSFAADMFGEGSGSGTITLPDPRPAPGTAVVFDTYSFSFTLFRDGTRFDFDFTNLRSSFGPILYLGTEDTDTTVAIETFSSPQLGMSGILPGVQDVPLWSVTTLVTCSDDEAPLFEDDPDFGCLRTWGGTYTISAVLPEPPVIPLPATAALLPLGLVALGALRRRKG